MINFQTNVPLKDLTTFKVGTGRAKFFASITDRSQIPELYAFASEHQLPVLILGQGSNSIAPDSNLEAIIAVNKLKGITKLDETTFHASSGELLDDLVAKTVTHGLYGIESMSGIPGTVGAAPIQNVGAYGQDISQTMLELEAYDTQTNKFVTLSTADCHFTYRNSIFKQQAKNRYFITAVTVKLHQTKPAAPFYASIQKYIDEHHVTDFTPERLRQIVLTVRGSKLPNYHQFPSAGSFFQNALVTPEQLDYIQDHFGEVPFAEPINGQIKIPTGWLIDQAGLRGQVLHGIKVDDHNALILLNHSATTFAELEQAVSDIKQTIFDKFKVQIQQEPINLTV